MRGYYMTKTDFTSLEISVIKSVFDGTMNISFAMKKLNLDLQELWKLFDSYIAAEHDE